MGTTHYPPMQAPGAVDHRCTRPPLAPARSLVEGLLRALASQAPATVPHRPRDHVQQEPARVAWEPVVHGAVALAEGLGQLAHRGRSRRGIAAGSQACPGEMSGLGWQGSPMQGPLQPNQPPTASQSLSHCTRQTAATLSAAEIRGSRGPPWLTNEWYLHERPNT
jgi:hypothetical protein